MRKQMFVVTLEVLSSFDRYFPRLEAERMANIIRDGVQAKSCKFHRPSAIQGHGGREEFDKVSEESAASLPSDTRSSDESRECDSDS